MTEAARNVAAELLAATKAAVTADTWAQWGYGEHGVVSTPPQLLAIWKCLGNQLGAQAERLGMGNFVAIDVLSSVIREQYPEREHSESSLACLYEFNDHVLTTLDDVHAVLSKALASLDG